MKTSWQIHTRGGPIRRIFTSLANAMKWARRQWHEHALVIGPSDEDDFRASYAIRNAAGRDQRVFATIGERQHCPTCGHVVATRSNVEGEWHPVEVDYLIPKDFEDE